MINYKNKFIDLFYTKIEINGKPKLTKEKCQFCKKFFIIRGLSIHELRCPKNPKNKGKVRCKKCGKLFTKVGINKHKFHCKK